MWGIEVLILMIFFIVIVGIIINNYYYPMCPKCGHNLRTKRKKGRKYCEVHGFFE